MLLGQRRFNGAALENDGARLGVFGNGIENSLGALRAGKHTYNLVTLICNFFDIFGGLNVFVLKF